MGKLKGRAPAPRLGREPSRLQYREGEAAPPRGAPRRSVDWLNTARWQRLRREILERDNYTCRQTGVLLVGVHPAGNSPVVDHIRPHRGDPSLFWDKANLQSVSKEWHDKVKQSRERRGLA